MAAFLEVTLPVFLVIGFGYLAVRMNWFPAAGADALMKFTQGFAIPCLLFTAISTLDLGAFFRAPLLFSYYAGATAAFLVAALGARYVFGREAPDSVAIGFSALFANSVLLGLPISERAFGADALAPNYALIAINAPYCYLLGITAMEIVLNRGAGVRATARGVIRAMFRNALMIGIALGLVVNLTGTDLPAFIDAGVALMVKAALPAALFGLGGVLVRYRPEGDLRIVAWIALCSLALHPAITWALSVEVFGLSEGLVRAAVVTAAMAPGVNSYLFADMYGRGRRVAATTVLISTAASILTATAWIGLVS